MGLFGFLSATSAPFYAQSETYIFIYNPDFASPAPLLDVFLCSYHQMVPYPEEYTTDLFFKYGVSPPELI